MKTTSLPLLILVCLAGCSRITPDKATTEKAPETSVTVTHISRGNIPKEIILSATTAYLNKSMITAPIPAFVSNVYVQPGCIVQAGQTLYTLETKEHHALSGAITPQEAGVISVKAGITGIVTSVSQQEGSYVPEGATLCMMAELNSLVFELNVPYEELRYTTPDRKCTLILPDETRLTATIQAPLATMNPASQTQQVIARARSPFLPEGMTVKVLVTANDGSGKERMILPKKAVQSDEMLSRYWVMKLADDTTAIKVPVKVWNSNTDSIEITSPTLSLTDRIILTGGYALEDSSRVVIIQ